MTMAINKALGEEAVGLGVLKALADNSFDSILITDTTKAGKIIYANKAFKTLTGYDPASVIGKNPRILQGLATDKKVIARLAQALKARKNFEGRTINYKKDGTPFIMQWRVVPAKIGRETRVWVAIQRQG
ncbi:MAG: PAS domain-containing protein [Arenicellales bacterium]